MTPGGSGPSVSVVVAAWPDTAGLARCLAGLARQAAPAAEVLVASQARPPAGFEQDFPEVRWLAAPADGLIPHLWSLGMSRSSGDVLALTTSHFTPAPDWVEVVRGCHTRLASPAIGGRIEPPRGGSAVDWATFFLRYGAYLGYDREQGVPDLAADNASYKRSALAAYPEHVREGFWEQRLHARLLAQGETLTFVPAMRVTQHASFGFRGFLAQRFEHGRQFGTARVSGRGAGFRAAAILGSPLVPPILLAKVAARVLQSGRDLAAFLRCLPALSCFVIAWGLGEAAGYLRPGAPAEKRREQAA